MHNKPVPQAVLDMFNRAQRGLGILSAAEACPRLETDELQSDGLAVEGCGEEEGPDGWGRCSCGRGQALHQMDQRHAALI